MMNEGWAWPALFLLGAYHGIHPGMGWLFAVALGMQERSRGAVVRSLLPIALGHALAIGAVVLLAALAGRVLPLRAFKGVVACLLAGFAVAILWRKRHPRWGGMQIGFRDLTIWSFLMASAHGAGFMLLPVLLQLPAPGQRDALPPGPLTSHAGLNLLAVVVHSFGYLLLTGLTALLVYEYLGLALLRKAWFNLDLLWAAALLAAAAATLAT